MATKGILLKDNNSNTVLPVTSADLIQVHYADQNKVLTTVLQEIESVTTQSINSVVDSIDASEKILYGSSSTSGSYQIKSVSLRGNSTFDEQYGTILNVSFNDTNTNSSNVSISVNGITRTIYRKFNGQIIPIKGAFLQKGYNYTFIYTDNDYWLLIDSDFHTDDVIEVCVVRNINNGTYMGSTTQLGSLDPESGGSTATWDSYTNCRAFLLPGLHFDDSIKKYKIILTFPNSLTYVNDVLGRSLSSDDYIQFNSFETYIVDNIAVKNKIYFLFKYLIDNETFRVHASIDISNIDNAFCNGTHTVGRQTEQHISAQVIKNSSLNKEIVGNLTIDTVSLNEAGDGSGTSWGSVTQSSNFKYKARHGLVMGIPPSRFNASNANIAVKYYDNKLNESTTSYFAMMQYQTPCVYVTNTRTTANPTSKFSSYYSFTYEGVTGFCYYTSGTKVTYSSCVKGNNYFDVSNSDKDMFYYDGETLRNYITANVDHNNKNIKILNSNSVIKYDTTESANYQTYVSNNTLKTQNITVGTSVNPGNFNVIFGNTVNDYNVNINSGSNQIKFTLGSSDSTVIFGANANINVTSSNSNGGKITAKKFFESSDERLKTDINAITDNDGINIYSFKLNGSEKTSYGFIAQQVEFENADLVDTSNGYMTVDYNSTLSLLLAQAMNKIQELENGRN